MRIQEGCVKKKILQDLSYQKNLFKLSKKYGGKNKHFRSVPNSEAKIFASSCKTTVHGQYAVLTMYVLEAFVPQIMSYLSFLEPGWLVDRVAEFTEIGI